MGSEGKKTKFGIFNFVVEPCANRCGSFGDWSTGNLCLRCYMDSGRFTRLGVEKLVLPRVPAAASVRAVERTAVKSICRCFSCGKKVGVVGFTCRCGGTFCGMHRYAEQHSCGFDYKSAGRENIVRSNPVVKADKLHCRI